MFLALLASIALSAEPSEQCHIDTAAMLALEQNDFDQNMDSGWRVLASKGCYDEAADLIQEWRLKYQLNDGILYWHEGQMRANAGQYDDAIRLFNLARKSEDLDAGWGWNLYVDGSIAFLRGDGTGLLNARQKLAALPQPENLNMVDKDGNSVAFSWPMNLHVLDAFIQCWGQSYEAAYACPTPE